mmetsp:Transcript_29982/g.74363  ORF Transcript_29982/g.74363 Transcript_29982/m.74363 type:complete len:229 (-) Transcript_29982:386-1072(-)
MGWNSVMFSPSSTPPPDAAHLCRCSSADSISMVTEYVNRFSSGELSSATYSVETRIRTAPRLTASYITGHAGVESEAESDSDAAAAAACGNCVTASGSCCCAPGAAGGSIPRTPGMGLTQYTPAASRREYSSNQPSTSTPVGAAGRELISSLKVPGSCPCQFLTLTRTSPVCTSTNTACVIWKSAATASNLPLAPTTGFPPAPAWSFISLVMRTAPARLSMRTLTKWS